MSSTLVRTLGIRRFGASASLNVARSFSVSRCSTASVETSVDSHGISTVSMNKGPANSLNLEFMEELRESLVAAEKNSKAIILSSSLPTIFCAGLEITEMYKPDQVRLRRFWRALQDLWIALYSCKVPTAAAIAGHSPAGGCLLAMSCDYRVMVGSKFTIGLNETKLGIVAPPWFKDTMLNLAGFRHTELSLMLGTLYSPQEALAIAILDKLVDNKEQALEESQKVLLKLMSIPPPARHASKMLMRQGTLDTLIKDQEADIDNFCNVINRPEMQAPLGKYLEALKNKKKGK